MVAALIATVMLLGLSAACASESRDDAATGTPPPTPTSTPTPEPDDSPTPTLPAPASPEPDPIPRADERLEAAHQHLAERFGYDPDDVLVISVERVTWPSTAMGCPMHGQDYEQTAIPGYRIVLGWEDLEYHFHGADDADEPFLCGFLD